MSLHLERKPIFQNCLEAEKHQFVEADKATIESVKVIITEMEDLVLDGLNVGDIPLKPFDFFRKRMPDTHYIKLCRLYTGAPLAHKDILELSLYTTEGEVSIPLLILNQGDVKLYLLSEGGNVSTLTRLAYKLIRLLFEMKHRSAEDVYQKTRRKRNKQEFGQGQRNSLLTSNGVTHA